MKTVVTASEFVNIIRRTIKGATILTVDLDSPMDEKGKAPKFNLTGNPFTGQGVFKRETLNGTAGYIYINAVNRIAAKEGKDERQAKPHPWGDMDEKHLFRIHRETGRPYLSMMFRPNNTVTVHGYFRPDGTQISLEAIKPFLKAHKKSSTQSDLEGEAVVRDLDMKNIRAVRWNGGDYEIIPDAPAIESETVNAETVPAETVNA
jgi:hypothetical protein